MHWAYFLSLFLYSEYFEFHILNKVYWGRTDWYEVDMKCTIFILDYYFQQHEEGAIHMLWSPSEGGIGVRRIWFGLFATLMLSLKVKEHVESIGSLLYVFQDEDDLRDEKSVNMMMWINFIFTFKFIVDFLKREDVIIEIHQNLLSSEDKLEELQKHGPSAIMITNMYWILLLRSQPIDRRRSTISVHIDRKCL